MNGKDTLNFIVQYGTQAERLGLDTSLIKPLTAWYETDTGNEYKWFGSWVNYPGAASGAGNPLGVKTLLDQSGFAKGITTSDGYSRFIGNSLRRDVAIAQQFIGNLGSTQSSVVRTYLHKISAPCEFDAIQLIVCHVGSTTPTIKAIVAVTETAANDTASNRFNPAVGGATYISVDANDQYGWKTVKWNGATTKTFAGTGTRYNMEYSISDVIPLSCVPRADIVGANPLWMCRIYNDGTAQSLGIATDTGFANMRVAGGANGNQIFQCAFDTGVDEVAIPGSNPGTLGIGTCIIGAIIYSRRSGASYITIGDSITENDGLVADKLSSWGLRASNSVSIQNQPISYVNAGASGQTSTTYLTAGLNALNLVKPNVAHYSAYSPNDYPASGSATIPILRNRIEKMASNLQVFLDYCAKNRIVPIVSTGIPNPHDLTTSSLDDLRKAYNNIIRSRASSGQFILCDFDAALSDNGSPAAIKSPYNSGDGIHPNEAGVAYMATIAAPALHRALF